MYAKEFKLIIPSNHSSNTICVYCCWRERERETRKGEKKTLLIFDNLSINV